MSHLAHMLLCDSCADPIDDDDDPIVVPGPGLGEQHFHRDPDCAPAEVAAHGVA